MFAQVDADLFLTIRANVEPWGVPEPETRFQNAGAKTENMNHGSLITSPAISK